MADSASFRNLDSEQARPGKPSSMGQPFGVITCLTPKWQVASRVTAFSTTRLGGLSTPPFDSLNLGLHVGDDPVAVLENRRRVREAFSLPGEPCWLRQTHSADIVSVGGKIGESSTEPTGTESGDSPGVSMNELTENPGSVELADRSIGCADGSWTDQPNTVLAILTADCLPVVISDVTGSQLAVVHAGWRGLAAGILENALQMFDPGAELHAWLGPAIGPDVFEVGDEVRQVFVDRNALHARSFLPGGNSQGSSGPVDVKFRADIYALARTELQLQRPVVVTGGEYCTVNQPQWFYSHRRDGTNSGRMVTLAWLDKASV